MHKPDDKNASQVRIQMQLVNQLEVQVSRAATVVVERVVVVVVVVVAVLPL